MQKYKITLYFNSNLSADTVLDLINEDIEGVVETIEGQGYEAEFHWDSTIETLETEQRAD